MPFSLCKAPGTFQWLMEKELRGLTCVVPPTVSGAKDQAPDVSTNAAECTIPGPRHNSTRGWRGKSSARTDQERGKVALGTDRVEGVHHPEGGALTSPGKILSQPDFDLTFLIDVNSSEDVVRAVLSQQGRQNPLAVIAYASRLISRAEQGYFIADALSHRTCKQCGLEGSFAEVPVGAVQLDAAKPIKQWQESDKQLQQIHECSTQKTWPQVASEGDHIPEMEDHGCERDTAAAGHPETEYPGDPGRCPQPAVRNPLWRGKDAGKVTSLILLAPATGRRRGLVLGVPDVCGMSGPDIEAPGTHATSAGRIPFPTGGHGHSGPLEETQNGNRYILVAETSDSSRTTEALPWLAAGRGSAAETTGKEENPETHMDVQLRPMPNHGKKFPLPHSSKDTAGENRGWLPATDPHDLTSRCLTSRPSACRDQILVDPPRAPCDEMLLYIGATKTIRGS
ncbi:hypothetical protein T4D_6139 [Trichinella pseudospiralis]|uniref:Reverse transcriptase/retrotransposon-derived protein RNase H-like domain-containing protein n=1 Tax=Trichinella pseudospiralis TaxID=6337 RepID=A0A0V1FCT6_TRIPS|nr:hypothetical protein T4D_6139 [Trichinella pseudospiralis]